MFNMFSIGLYVILGKALVLEEDCEVLAGSNSSGYEDGLNADARFQNITAIGIWLSDELVVTDGSCVRGVSSSHTRTISGSCNVIGSVTGSADNARFTSLIDIAVSDESLLYGYDGTTNVALWFNASGYSWSLGKGRRTFLSLSIHDNILAMTSIHEIFNCTVSPMMCTIIAGVDGTQGYMDGDRYNSLFNYPQDAVSMWGAVIVADTYNYCLRNISESSTDTFFGVCENRGNSAGGDDYLFLPMKLTPTFYDTLIVLDHLNLREVNREGNGTTFAVFDEPSYDVLVVGNVLYVAFRHYILKCQWTSMTHRASTFASKDVHETSIAGLLTVAVLLVFFAIFVGTCTWCYYIRDRRSEKVKSVIQEEDGVEGTAVREN